MISGQDIHYLAGVIEDAIRVQTIVMGLSAVAWFCLWRSIR